MKHDGTKVTWHKEIADTPLQITGFGIDSQGRAARRRPRAGQAVSTRWSRRRQERTPTDVPAKLSESGLFER